MIEMMSSENSNTTNTKMATSRNKRRVGASNSFRCTDELLLIGGGHNGNQKRPRSIDLDSSSLLAASLLKQRPNSMAVKNHHQTNIVHEILLKQDLSRAGVLFSLTAPLILDDFPMTVEILKSFIDSKHYAANLNQQSIVEIVLTKCISALRETKLISNYYDDLLDIIEICLKYSLSNTTPSPNKTATTTTGIANNNSVNMNENSDDINFGGMGRLSPPIRYVDDDISTSSPTHQHTNSNSNHCFSSASNGGGGIGNMPAHANIVSDILSCILLDYLDDELSMKAIPVCIKILHHHSAKRELIREIVSYLNLIACRSPELLVDYVYYLASGMLKGYAGLGGLLFQIAESHIDCIYPLVKHFVRALKLIESVPDFNYVLQIIYLVSLSHVQLTIVYLDEILAYMPDTNYQDIVLDIIYSIASQSPIALEPYLKLFDSQIYYESFKIEKIISTVGKSIKKHSEYCTELLVKRIKYLMNKHKREVDDMEKQRRQQRRYSLIHQQQHQQQQFEYLMMEERQHEDGDEADAEEDSMNTSHNVSSFDYSASHRNNGRRVRTSASFQYSERLSSSNAATSVAAAAATIANSRRVLNRRFVQLLTEIYEIAQVFPYVLNPHLTELEHLFRKYAAYSTTITPTTTIITTPTTSTSCNNNDKSSGNETTAGETLPTATTTAQSETSYESIAYLIERLRELQRENSPKMSSREEDLDDLSSTNNEEASLSGGCCDRDRLLLDNSSGKEEEEINTVSSSSISRSTSNQEKRSSELRGEGGGGATTTTTTETTTVLRPNYNQQQKDEDTINSYINSRHQTHEEEENIEVEEEDDGSNQQLRREGVEEDYELIALANNLAIKDPELARPDDDDEYDEAAVVAQNLAGQEQEDRFDACPPPPNVNLSASLFNHDLNRQIEESKHPISSTMRIPPSFTHPQIELNSLRTSSLMYSDRGDVVERFCTKHGDKIRNYVRELTRTLPIPDLNLDEMIIPNPDVLNKSYTAQHNTISFCKRLKSPKPTFTLKFSCSRKQANCCLFDKNYFEVQTAHPAVWIHLIFLATQAKMNRALNQTDKELIQLKLVYEKLSEKLPFVALVTSSFPQDKQINELVKELKESRLFDLFEYKPSSCCDHNLNSNNVTSATTTCSDWQCYLCANPERALDLSEDNAARPLIQGQLKEKHGKWKFLRRWHKRVFTLTGSNIVYFKKDMRQESLNVRYIRSIQPIPSSKADKNVPKVFEIFTNRNSFLLKAQNSRDAAQWLQFLQLTKALQNSRNATENNNNNPNNNSNDYYYNHTANNLNNSIVNTTTNVVNDNQ